MRQQIENDTQADNEIFNSYMNYLDHQKLPLLKAEVAKILKTKFDIEVEDYEQIVAAGVPESQPAQL